MEIEILKKSVERFWQTVDFGSALPDGVRIATCVATGDGASAVLGDGELSIVEKGRAVRMMIEKGQPDGDHALTLVLTLSDGQVVAQDVAVRATDGVAKAGGDVEGGTWITTENGRRLFIADGETAAQALGRATGGAVGTPPPSAEHLARIKASTTKVSEHLHAAEQALGRYERNEDNGNVTAATKALKDRALALSAASLAADEVRDIQDAEYNRLADALREKAGGASAEAKQAQKELKGKRAALKAEKEAAAKRSEVFRERLAKDPEFAARVHAAAVKDLESRFGVGDSRTKLAPFGAMIRKANADPWEDKAFRVEMHRLMNEIAKDSQSAIRDIAQPVQKSPSRAYTGHFAQPTNAAHQDAYAVRAYGSGPDDKRVFRAKTAGLPVATCPECDADAQGERREVTVKELALSRNALSRGKMSRMANALRDGVREGDDFAAIKVAELHDGEGEGPRYAVLPGQGNHRVAHLMLSRKAGTVPVMVVPRKGVANKPAPTAKQLSTPTPSKGAEWTPVDMAGRRARRRESVARKRKKTLTR